MVHASRLDDTRRRWFARCAETGAPIHATGIDEIAEVLVWSRQAAREVAIASRELEPVAQCLGVRERTAEGIPVLRFGISRRGRLDRAALRALECLIAGSVLIMGAPLWAAIAAVWEPSRNDQ